MTKILFVCHGNICRSPMARFIMEELIQKEGLSDGFWIDSAATSTEELGNGLYYPAEQILRRHGIPCTGHIARQIKRQDYETYDLLIGMDHANIRNMRNAFGGDPDGKIRLMSKFGDFEGEIADPWYTRDFELSFRQIENGCHGLLKYIKEEK